MHKTKRNYLPWTDSPARSVSQKKPIWGLSALGLARVQDRQSSDTNNYRDTTLRTVSPRQGHVIIAALRSKRGASARLLSLLGLGHFEYHLSLPLVVEYETVIQRQQQTLSLSKTDVTDLIDALCALGHHHEIYFLWRPALRDSNDEMLLDLAIAAQC